MYVGEDHVVSILCCGGGSSLHLGLVCCCWDSSNFVGGLLVVTLVGLWLLHSTLCWSPVVLCMVVGKCSNFVQVLFVRSPHGGSHFVSCGSGTHFLWLPVWLQSLHQVAAASLALFELT